MLYWLLWNLLLPCSVYAWILLHLVGLVTARGHADVVVLDKVLDLVVLAFLCDGNIPAVLIVRALRKLVLWIRRFVIYLRAIAASFLKISPHLLRSII